MASQSVCPKCGCELGSDFVCDACKSKELGIDPAWYLSKSLYLHWVVVGVSSFLLITGIRDSALRLALGVVFLFFDVLVAPFALRAMTSAACILRAWGFVFGLAMFGAAACALCAALATIFGAFGFWALLPAGVLIVYASVAVWVGGSLMFRGRESLENDETLLGP